MTELTVIGAGLPRTGTTSLKAALERLGFGPCYHMFDLVEHPEHAQERWIPAMSGDSDWRQALNGYRSAVDTPAVLYWRELVEEFPDAKVILSVRDPRRWYASMQNLMLMRQTLDMAEIPAPMRGIAAIQEHMTPRMAELLGEPWVREEADEDYAVEAFARHTAAVREAVPPERLLVFEAGQGWEPLCDFLGVEAPADEPYPHLNDSGAVQQLFKQVSES